MPLTHEERERRAYANGQVEEARLLAEVVDGEWDRVSELEHENRVLRQEVEDLRYELEGEPDGS